MLDQVIVSKYGSETVADDGGIIQSSVNRYAEQWAEIPCGLIVVSSGAVKAGRAEAPLIEDEQVLAGLGSAAVVMAWKAGFARAGRFAGQVLATDHEISDPGEGGTLRCALRKDIQAGVVPIFNTNDKLNAEELDKRQWRGENDGPAAHIAEFMGARTLCLMTKRNGVFDDDRKPIREVPYGLEAHQHVADMVASRGPKGQGIGAKVAAAIKASRAGIDVFIAGADEAIADVLAGRTGTHFVAKERPGA